MARTGSIVVALALVLSVCGCHAEPGGGPDASEGDAGPPPACAADDECDDGRFCNGDERCDPASSAADERGCTPGQAPCASSVCEETADRCRVSCDVRDADGDGAEAIACGGIDCDDGDPARYPGAVEVCDPENVDEDCDPRTIGERDADGDGATDAACCNVDGAGDLRCGGDCDDANAGASPRATETCNAIDDDCDGATDEGVQLALWPDDDGDGFGTDDASATAMHACAPSAGWVIARGDCDDAAAGRNPGVPEVCNAIDDDCDRLTDDVVPGAVVCTAGSSAPCVTGCGVDGTQACRADCLGYGACVGAETCNGCDDDADGARDEDFACERGFPVGCTTACGTRGTRQCTATCELESCVAPEVCNYCDDDGVNGYADERALAIDSASIVSRGGGTYAGVAHEDGIPQGSSTYIVARLLDGATVDQAGAYWIDLPGGHVGWGLVRIQVQLEARVLDAGYPFGGWSVVVARAGGADIGPSTGLGVPAGLTGARFDWWWSATDYFTGNPYAGDAKGYRAMLASGATVVRGNTRFDATARTDIANNDADLNQGSTGWVTQRVIIEYQPENPYTSVREERVRFVTNGGETIYAPDDSFETLDPASDLPVGLGPLRIGITAGSHAYTYTPSGAPGPVTLGARVEARLSLALFTPPSGPGSPTWVDYVGASRTLICPEL